ncbi:MAG: hypothetical protein ACKO23_03295 [Gemmataceae bacterium]
MAKIQGLTSVVWLSGFVAVLALAGVHSAQTIEPGTVIATNRFSRNGERPGASIPSSPSPAAIASTQVHPSEMIQPVNHQVLVPVSAQSVLPPLPGLSQTSSGAIPQKIAAVSVEVRDPVRHEDGETATCQINVKNVGLLSLAGVLVDIPLPSSFQLLRASVETTSKSGLVSWSIRNLSPGEEKQLLLEGRAIRGAEIQLVPVIRYTAGSFLSQPSATEYGTLQLKLSCPASRFRGQSIPLQIEMKNLTSKPMSKMQLRCDLSPGLSHPQGSSVEADLDEELLPGQSRSIPLEVVARQSGSQEISVTAVSSNGGRAQASAAIQVEDVAIPLSIRGSERVQVGKNIELLIEVGEIPRGVPSPTVALRLPRGTELISAGSNGQHNPATNAVTWKFGPESMGRATLSCRLQARVAGVCKLEAILEGEGVTPASASHSIRIDPNTSLSMEWTAAQDRLLLGREMNFELRLYNPGPAPVQGVRVVVDLPETMQATQADGPTRWQISGRQVVFEPLPELKARIDGIYQIRVRGVRTGQGQVRAEVYAAGAEKPQVQARGVLVEINPVLQPPRLGEPRDRGPGN